MGLKMICSAIGRLIKSPERSGQEAPPAVSTAPASVIPVAASGIHPGLTDQQLVVLLTAAACEVMGGHVRIERFRSLTTKDWNWVAQGRSELHTHRLK